MDTKPTSDPIDIEAKFRDGLSDVVSVLEKLAPFISNVDELIEMLKLAVENPSQLRLVMGRVLKHRSA